MFFTHIGPITDSLVPLDLKAGARLHGRARPTKFNNNQLNFSPNLLHLTPPAVKAHCKELVKLGTAFPKEYKTDYERMRTDFPIEFHTTVSNAFTLNGLLKNCKLKFSQNVKRLHTNKHQVWKHDGQQCTFK